MNPANWILRQSAIKGLEWAADEFRAEQSSMQQAEVDMVPQTLYAFGPPRETEPKLSNKSAQQFQKPRATSLSAILNPSTGHY
jgi:hypothetical protein